MIQSLSTKTREGSLSIKTKGGSHLQTKTPKKIVEYPKGGSHFYL